MTFEQWWKSIFYPQVKNPWMNSASQANQSKTNGSAQFTDFWTSMVDQINGNSSAATQYGYNKELQEDAQQWASEENAANREFQAEQEATRYQRAAADLRAAGLNPWLAVNGMSGSAASGSVGSSSANSVSQPPSGAQTLSSLATTAASAALIVKIIKMLK